jgi:hypothetical protein
MSPTSRSQAVACRRCADLLYYPCARWHTVACVSRLSRCWRCWRTIPVFFYVTLVTTSPLSPLYSTGSRLRSSMKLAMAAPLHPIPSAHCSIPSSCFFPSCSRHLSSLESSPFFIRIIRACRSHRGSSPWPPSVTSPWLAQSKAASIPSLSVSDSLWCHVSHRLSFFYLPHRFHWNAVVTLVCVRRVCHHRR